MSVNWFAKLSVRQAARYLIVAALTFNGVTTGLQFATPAYRVATVIAVVICGAVAARRPHGWYVVPVTTTAAAVVFGTALLPLLMLALYDLGTQRRVPAAAICAVVVASFSLVAPVGSVRMDASTVAVSLVLFAVVTAVGTVVGRRREGLEELNNEIEHLRAERVLGEERAREAERARIALEMHDVLAHRLSLIALHAGVLEAKAATVPEPVRERLTLLRTASTDALNDLRDVLGALRAPDGREPRRPVLSDVEELVTDARQAGQDISLNVDALVGEISTAQRLAVQRIVQEGLTNARKHAAGGSVTVDIDRVPDAVLVAVRNTAGTSLDPQAPPGFGLVGLRERVRALGGSIDVGPEDNAAWAIRGRIPLASLTNRTAS